MASDLRAYIPFNWPQPPGHSQPRFSPASFQVHFVYSASHKKCVVKYG